ncbi:MAG: hypothetical protein JNK05_32730 [Myxococcales bacterium]|nr:hypothetical protein [Myxococcales bacterium]
MSKASREIARILESSDDNKVAGELHQFFNAWELTDTVDAEIAMIEQRFPKPIFAANNRWIDRVFSGEDEPRMRVCNKFIVTGPYAFKVRGKKLGDEHYENMCRAEHMGGVTYYASTVSATMGARTFVAFADAKTLVNLRELDLSFSKPGKKGMTALGAAKSLTKVTRLALVNCKLDDAQIAAFCAGAGLESLTSLSLARNPIGPRGAAAIASSAMMANLETLQLGSCSLTDETLAALVTGPHLSRVKHLKIDDNARLTTSACASLAQACFAKSLETLDLSQVRIDEPSLAALLRACPSLTGLRIGYSGLASVAPLVAHEPGFTMLSLDNCPIGLEGLRAILAAPWFSKLESLLLGDTVIGPEGYLALAAADLSSMETLSVTTQGATPETWAAFLANPTLRESIREPFSRLSQYVR